MRPVFESKCEASIDHRFDNNHCLHLRLDLQEAFHPRVQQLAVKGRYYMS